MKTEVTAVRKLDELGRVVIPVDMRKALNWEYGAEISISMQGELLVLQACHSSCVFCGSKTNLKPIQNKFICEKCIEEIIK